MWRLVLSCWSQCHKAGLQQQISDRASPGLPFFLFWRKYQFTSIYSHPFLSDSKSYTNNTFTIIKRVQRIGLENKILCTAFIFFLASVHPGRRKHTPTEACWEEPLLSKEPLREKAIPSTRAVAEGPQHPRSAFLSSCCVGNAQTLP